MTRPRDNHLYLGAALGLALAAGAGFGVARWTAPVPAPPAAAPADAALAAPADTVALTAEGIVSSEITVAPAEEGTLDAAIAASATVSAAPDAEAVLTARAAGTVTRIFKRIGDAVRAGETVALVESRDASGIVADRSAAAARVTLAQRQLAREGTLLGQGVSPRADYETAQAALAVAEADARRAAAAAGTARVAADGRSVTVISPIAGRVIAAPGSLGAFVQAETALFRVADPRRLQIAASVPAAEVARVRPGDSVELTAAGGTPIEGRVRAATGVVDAETRTATVVIVPRGGSVALAPGQLVRARIFASGGAARTGVTVPQDAVQTLGDRSVVFVRTPDGFRAQTVRVAGRSGGMAEIASGLTSGTPVATVNAFLLKAELGKDQAE